MMAAAILRAQVDANGILQSADAPLRELQARIGGTDDGPLIIPQLARLCALAQRLGTPLSRPVIAADDAQDITMWARFIPNGDGTTIEITEWNAQIRADTPLNAAQSGSDAILSSEWMWRCDGQLRLSALWPSPGYADIAIETYLGGSISDLFSLLPDAYGRFPMLSAMASEQDFGGQSAHLIARLPHGLHPPQYMLTGSALRDDQGRFSGFTGRAIEDSAEIDDPELPLDNPFDVAPIAPVPAPTVYFGKDVDASMRTPISRIIANADSISARTEGPIRQDYANYARDIALAGRHLLGLIDDLADVQAIERANFTVAQEAVELADVARRATGLLRVKMQEKSMVVKLPSADDAAIATGEFRRILQILINLIGNAVRYAPDGSEIWISTDDHDDGTVSITVADQGSGIAEDDQARIFEKFERLGRNDHGGSGLGLYISRRLARAMNGDLAVQSAPGQGAQFTLRLPKSAN